MTTRLDVMRGSVPVPRQAPPPVVRGTAVPEQVAPTPPAGPPRPARRPGMVGAVHVVQVVLWQAAFALALASLGRHPAVTAAAFTTAAVVLALTALRIGHRWLYEWIVLWLSWVCRSRVCRFGVSGRLEPDRRTELLQFVLPGTVVDDLKAGVDEVGVLEHLAGAAVVVEIGGESGLLAERPVGLPSPAALLPPYDPDTPPVSLQLLLHTVPAPTLTAASVGAASSYYALTNGSVPAQQRAWLVLQLAHSADCPATQVRHALGNALRRLLRRLRGDGFTARPLGRDEVLTTIAALAHLDTDTDMDTGMGTGPDPGGARRAGPTTAFLEEDWGTWRSGPVAQTCFAVRRWPDLDTADGRRWIGHLTSVPSSGTTVSLVVRQIPAPHPDEGSRPPEDPAAPGTGRHPERRTERHDAQPSGLPGDRPEGGTDDVVLELAVRIAAPDEQRLASVSSALLERARVGGGALERLDGRQLHGLCATLPFGGVVR